MRRRSTASAASTATVGSEFQNSGVFGRGKVERIEVAQSDPSFGLSVDSGAPR